MQRHRAHHAPVLFDDIVHHCMIEQVDVVVLDNARGHGVTFDVGHAAEVASLVVVARPAVEVPVHPVLGFAGVGILGGDAPVADALEVVFRLLAPDAHPVEVRQVLVCLHGELQRLVHVVAVVGVEIVGVHCERGQTAVAWIPFGHHEHGTPRLFRSDGGVQSGDAAADHEHVGFVLCFARGLLFGYGQLHLIVFVPVPLRRVFR